MKIYTFWSNTSNNPQLVHTELVARNKKAVKVWALENGVSIDGEISIKK